MPTTGTNFGGAEDATLGTVGHGLQEREWALKIGCSSVVVGVGGGRVDVGTKRNGIGDGGVVVGVMRPTTGDVVLQARGRRVDDNGLIEGVDEKVT